MGTGRVLFNLTIFNRLIPEDDFTLTMVASEDIRPNDEIDSTWATILMMGTVHPPVLQLELLEQVSGSGLKGLHIGRDVVVVGNKSSSWGEIV